MTRSSGKQLDLGLTTARPPRGRAERAVDASAKAARERETLDPVHASALTLARQLARGLDDAERRHDGYLIAALARELRQVLDGLRWLPEAETRDDLDDLLAGLGTPAMVDPPRP